MKLLRMAQVCELVGVSRATIYRWIASGSFPVPLKIGPAAVRWRLDDIEKWVSGHYEHGDLVKIARA